MVVSYWGIPTTHGRIYSLPFGLPLTWMSTHPIMQCLTPYPKTETREQLLSRGLITNLEDYSRYNGFICNVRTKYLSNRELNRAIFCGGLRLYFSPRYLKKSRFWRYKPSLWPSLMVNNFRYQIGAIQGKTFASRHTW